MLKLLALFACLSSPIPMDARGDCVHACHMREKDCKEYCDNQAEHDPKNKPLLPACYKACADQYQRCYAGCPK